LPNSCVGHSISALSIADLYAIVSMLGDKGVAFNGLDDAAVDTTSRTGKLVMGILALIAECVCHGRERARGPT
jgi:DNA invertase Pin-like site-specific DNA recombinase